MAPRVISIEDKIAVLDKVINIVRKWDRSPGSEAQQQYEALKSLAVDLRGRLEAPRSQTLGELTRLLQKMKDAPRDNGFYSRDYVTAIVNTVVSRWGTISQALELFGEESAE